MNLIIAKNKVEIAELAKIKTPPATDSFQPIGHFALAELTRKCLLEAGYEITAEEHATARGGLRYFGGFAVTGPEIVSDERVLVVGLRNSNDKGFAASICLGNSMMVCENLSFYSLIKLARRHTSFIMRDIEGVIAKAIGSLGESFIDMEKRIRAYKAMELDRKLASDLVYALAAKGGLPPRDMFSTIKEWEAPRHPEFAGGTLWTLFNAVTEQLKGSDLSKLPDRTRVVQSVFDGVCVEIEAEVVA